MKKEDLKTGMYVELRNGSIHVVTASSSGVITDIKNGMYIKIEKITDNLTIINSRNFDIVKVYKDHTMKELLWKRPKDFKLTDDEKAILRNLPKEYKYITRDGSSNLYIYKEKPKKEEENDFEDWSGYGWENLSLFNHLFQFVKWENEEPYLISDLLEE